MRIKYSKKETKNLGNYENVTIEISAEDDVDLSKENEEKCFLRLKEFVVSRLDKEFKIDIEGIKNNISKLINIDRSNKDIIKNILKSYGAEKLPDLNQEQLEKFNLKLSELLK